MLGLIFLVIGFALFLAEAGYGALRDRLSASRRASRGVSAARGDRAGTLMPIKSSG